MRLTALSDHQLIQLYINGNERALREVIDRHKDRVFTYLVLLLKDKLLAEDMFQDVLVRIIDFIRQGKYHEDGKFKSFMMQVAHNLAMDHFRKAKHIQLQHSTEEFDVFSIISNGDMTREDLFVQEQTHEDLRSLVALLPEEYREVVIMRIHAKMAFKEIAWVYNVKLPTATGKMRRALQMLRELMVEHNIKLVA